MIYFRSLGVSTCCIALHAARVKHSHDLHTDFKKINSWWWLWWWWWLPVFAARCYAECSYYIVCRLSVRRSVRLSVTFRYRDHIGWNTSKIISWPNSLRPTLLLTPTWAIWCGGNTPKLGWNRVGLSVNYRGYILADYNFNMCTYLFTLTSWRPRLLAPVANRRFVAIFVVDRTLLRDFEWKNETCDILVPNELKKMPNI